MAMDPKDITKFFVARNAPDYAPDSSQVIVAWKEDDTTGTRIDPEKLIGKTIIKTEYVQTTTGKTLFIYVK